MTLSKELTCHRHWSETNSNTTNYYLFIMEISPSFPFLPLPSLTFSSPIPPTSPTAPVYWRKNGVDSEKQLPVICLSLSPSDDEFQVKGEIIILSLTKSMQWAGTALVTICGMPYGIKGFSVTHPPTYSTHTHAVQSCSLNYICMTSTSALTGTVTASHLCATRRPV